MWAKGAGAHNLRRRLGPPKAALHASRMRFLLNLLWLVFGGGFLIWVEYVLGGLLLCLTIVGIPFGLQCFKIAGFGVWPFGRTAVQSGEGTAIGCVLNVLWVVCAGFWIFLSHVGLALSLAVTIIGIPFALQHGKLALLAFAPFGLSVREVD
jgi:uncharacterized membrane protein YccF (DUF307 family)